MSLADPGRTLTRRTWTRRTQCSWRQARGAGGGVSTPHLTMLKKQGRRGRRVYNGGRPSLPRRQPRPPGGPCVPACGEMEVLWDRRTMMRKTWARSMSCSRRQAQEEGRGSMCIGASCGEMGRRFRGVGLSWFAQRPIAAHFVLAYSTQGFKTPSLQQPTYGHAVTARTPCDSALAACAAQAGTRDALTLVERQQAHAGGSGSGSGGGREGGSRRRLGQRQR